MRANYHTHCSYCDGSASASEMACAARAAGLEVLGFSSHAPIGGGLCGGNMRPELLGAYLAEIRALARDWEGRGLEILLGLELDWLRGDPLPGGEFYAGLGLDYTIGSVHFINLGGGPFAVDGPLEIYDRRLREDAGGDGRLVWRAYYRELRALIEAGGFDILGHFDVVLRNNPGDLRFDREDPAYREEALGAAGLLAGRGIVVEVNYGAVARGYMGTPYPSLFILKELRRLGVPISLSADAHAPEHLASRREDAREHARSAGYEAVAVLTDGKWIEVGLDEA